MCTSIFNWCFSQKVSLWKKFLLAIRSWNTFLYSYLILVQERIGFKDVKNVKHDSTVGSNLGEVNKALPLLDGLTIPPPPALGEFLFF